jgi:hypothetical protein
MVTAPRNQTSLTAHFRQRVRVCEPPVTLLSRLHIQVPVEAHGGFFWVIPQLSQYDGRQGKTLAIG